MHTNWGRENRMSTSLQYSEALDNPCKKGIWLSTFIVGLSSSGTKGWLDRQGWIEKGHFDDERTASFAAEMSAALPFPATTSSLSFDFLTFTKACLGAQRSHATLGKPKGRSSDLALMNWTISSLAFVCLVQWSYNQSNTSFANLEGLVTTKLVGMEFILRYSVRELANGGQGMLTLDLQMICTELQYN